MNADLRRSSMMVIVLLAPQNKIGGKSRELIIGAPGRHIAQNALAVLGAVHLTGADLDKAIAAFDRAIARDPQYSAAYSGRAFAILLRPMWGAPAGDTLAIARNSAEQALLLDPTMLEMLGTQVFTAASTLADAANVTGSTRSVQPLTGPR